MAAFYGLWTYLTHTVFNASIITVPVLVATFLASVPVAGQYLVALPAALELWILGMYKQYTINYHFNTIFGHKKFNLLRIL